MAFPDQCRAARALLRWTALDVANRAGIGIATVKRFEGGQSIASTSLVAIKRALEDAGAIFLADGEDGGNGGPGVRLRKETE